jgi:hypothetical protein
MRLSVSDRRAQRRIGRFCRFLAVISAAGGCDILTLMRLPNSSEKSAGKQGI